MEELRKLWHLLDIHDISITPRYIQSAANVWADRLSRELDDADWQLNPRIFSYLQRLWGPHNIDRPSGSILLYVRKQKATNVIGFPLSPMLHLPIVDVPDPADLLDWYSTSRDASSRPPPNFWSVSPLEPSATWSLSATLAD
eukprot:jgi/Tetstr1/445881/TSEL_033520.t1